jgi:hypothetical protein
MAVEKLGGWKNPRSHDGPGHWGRPGKIFNLVTALAYALCNNDCRSYIDNDWMGAY